MMKMFHEFLTKMQIIIVICFGTDFRSRGSGIYDNLTQFNLPYPEAIFDISYFRSR